VNDEFQTTLLKKVDALDEAIGKILTGLNDAPAVGEAAINMKTKSLEVPGDGIPGAQPVQKRWMDDDEMDEVRARLSKAGPRELHLAFAKQAAKRDTGIPLGMWLQNGGRSLDARFNGLEGSGGIRTEVDLDIAKAIDTGSASALIRQDLEPILYELFVRQFPLFDRLEKEPANGLVHAYNQMTSYGDADWIGELDTVTDDRGSYVRQITNVGILATRRGVSLKSQFAVLQGGAGFNPERLELTAGLRAMSSRYQKTILHGNWSDNTGTLNNEKGPYDDDSFDGLRKILNTASAVNVDPATNPDTTGSLRRAIDDATIPITESGGDPTAIFGAPLESQTFDRQQEDKQRIVVMNGEDITAGLGVTAVKTNAGTVPLYTVRGGAVSSYTATGTYSGNTVRDLYILDENSISIPYLGAAGPTVLEIPIGVTGQLTHLFIIFFMGGLAVKAPTWNNKVRVKAA